MNLTAVLAQSGGIARTRSIIDAGVSPHFIARGAASGSVLRPGRGWIALPGTDPALLAAARHGWVLTCITQAKRLGLWVLDDSETHVAATYRGNRHRPQRGTLHWGTPLVSRPPATLEDSLENVLHYVSTCQPREVAISIWDSALNQRRTDTRSLRALPLSRRQHDLLDACSPFADSGLESFVRVRTSWLRCSIVSQAWVLGHRVDFLFDGWLVLQIDGGHHVGAQRDRDNAHDAELRACGYDVIRVSYRQVIDRWPEVQELIMRALARGRPGRWSS